MVKKGVIAGLGGVAGAVGGLVALNRSVKRPREELEPQLPVEPQMWKWRLGDVAVYEAGDPANPPLLLLHGHNAAASAAEMREPFQRLSGEYHVYAPDLLGYGLSDRPDVAYTPQLYIELIAGLLREVVGRPAAVLASSLSSAHAISVAADNPEWVTTLILVCPTGVRRLLEQSRGGGWIERLLRLPVLGEGLFNALASRPSIRYFLEKQAYHDPSLVTEELVDGYYRAAHAPGARYAPAAFVSGALYHDASDAWGRIESNCLVVWGREAKITPLTDAAPFAALNPRAALEVIDNAGILPHDEQPERFARVVSAWLEQHKEAL